MTSRKITINGKEIDITNLPPEAQEFLKDSNNDGIPDIANNPFAMLAKLGKFAAMAKEHPVLISNIKKQLEETSVGGNANADADGEQLAFEAMEKENAQPSLMKMDTMPAQSRSINRPANDWRSVRPPIKKDTGRRVLFIIVVIGLFGWALWQYLGSPELPF